MKIRVFTLRFDPNEGRFHDEELEAFFEDKDALQVSEHFFVFDQLPTLGLVVKYRVGTFGAATNHHGQ